MIAYNRKLKSLSQQLRNNMTDAEKLLWSYLRGRQVNDLQFYRQKIIGNYIVDFYCSKASLVIELDGGQHYDHKAKQKDRQRDEYLASLGLKVLRFSNRDMFDNHKGVIDEIWKTIHS